MEQYVIKGGNPLVGDVVIGGAKMQRLAYWLQRSWQMSL